MEHMVNTLIPLVYDGLMMIHYHTLKLQYFLNMGHMIFVV